MGYSNIFEQDSTSTHQLYIDMERLITVVGVRWGAGEGLELGGRATFETDISLMLLGRLSESRWHVHGTAGGSTIRASRDFPTVLRSSAWFLDVGLERVLAPWMSALVQCSAATPHLKGVHDPEVDGWPGNFVFGAAGRIGPSWRWNVSFQEDIPPVSPAIHFRLGVGVRRTW